ncbi:hypothetical protein P4T04_19425 [Bacillus badius]|uniref:hypothetical protein n=1 Tax=Bacillus badius TaxID=1455 RepID=UPI002E1DB0AB|nr:hypothetical protein [Bacillus badius]
MIKQIIRWIVLTILMVSSINFAVVFQLDYVAEALMARALPLAIVIGFSSIATSIMFRK